VKTLDAALLAQVQGAASPPKPINLKTTEELFPGKVAPYGQWTTWGSKTAGQPAPPFEDPSGIRYTFWGRPARNAIIVNAPRF